MWLLSCSYNSNRNNIVSHMKNISTLLDRFNATCDNLILIGYFDVELKDNIYIYKIYNILDFLNMYNLKDLVKQKTCYKKPDHPLRIDSVLSNWHRSFQNTAVFEAGLFNVHKMTVFVFHISPSKNLIISYHGCKRYCNNSLEMKLRMNC